MQDGEDWYADASDAAVSCGLQKSSSCFMVHLQRLTAVLSTCTYELRLVMAASQDKVIAQLPGLNKKRI